jgi:hypothetical protein
LRLGYQRRNGRAGKEENNGIKEQEGEEEERKEALKKMSGLTEDSR